VIAKVSDGRLIIGFTKDDLRLFKGLASLEMVSCSEIIFNPIGCSRPALFRR
jgi:hypothetical protein